VQNCTCGGEATAHYARVHRGGGGLLGCRDQLLGRRRSGDSAGSPPVYRGAGDEDVPVMLGEARLTPGSLVNPPLVGAERRSPTPAAGRRSPTPAAGGRSSAPATGRRSSPPATGRRTPVPAVSMGGGGSAASAETPAQTASRLQADPRTTPSGQSSRGVSVLRARWSGSGKRSMSARSG